MATWATEQINADAEGLDTRPDAQVLNRLLNGQRAALDAVGSAIEALSQGAGLMADAMRGSGRLVYAGAGSSALMAVADGLELVGTFGITPDRVTLLMAGGIPTDPRMPGTTEDDSAEASRAASGIGAGDVVIAVAASGRTPYTLTIARLARENGARTICIANTADAPIFEHADVAVCLPTPPEIVAGSTRMGAGTAQKAALNMMSTLMGLRLGHVYDGMMVNVRPDNTKLKARAAAIVSRISGASDSAAEKALLDTNWSVKPAVLIAAGAKSLHSAEKMLNDHNGNLRTALAQIRNPG